MTPDLTAASVYTDLSGFAQLKKLARENSPAALKEVAQQFEAVFMQMVLKSMRDANLGEGIMDSDQTKFYQQMFDQQLALELPKRQGLGLADTIVRQLEPTLNTENTPSLSLQTTMMENPLQVNRLRSPIVPETLETQINALPDTAVTPDVSPHFDTPESFVQAMWPYAEKVAESLDIAPDAVLAQSALETGWGQNIIAHPDGHSSFNLFGIKADANWSGDTVTVPTKEFINGRPVTKMETFRSYDSFADSFEDYRKLLGTSPRYSTAIAAGRDPSAFGPALQQAGYATDPEYGGKIGKIMQGGTLQQALAQLKGDSYAPLI